MDAVRVGLLCAVSLCCGRAVTADEPPSGPPAPSTRPDEAVPAPPITARMLYEQYVLARVACGGSGRPTDLAIDRGQRCVYICQDLLGRVLCFDIATGRLLRSFGELEEPFFVRLHDGRLYVADEAGQQEGEGGVLRVYDPGTGTLERTVNLPDPRLYRIWDIAFSPDGKWCWLVSSEVLSSMYDNIAPALFRVDLEAGRCEQMAGSSYPTRVDHSRPSDPLGALYPFIAIAMDSKGRLLTNCDAPDTLTVFEKDGKRSAKSIKLPFQIWRLAAGTVAQGGKGKPVCLARGEEAIAFVDLDELAVVGSVETGRDHRAWAWDGGQMAFITSAKRNLIYRLNVAEMKFEKPLVLQQPRDHIRALRPLDDRLAVILSGRQFPEVIDLADGSIRSMETGKLGRMAVQPGKNRAVICAANGYLLIVDFALGQCVGSIALDAQPIDVAFTDSSTAFVSDWRGKRLLKVDVGEGKVLDRIALQGAPSVIWIDLPTNTVLVRLKSDDYRYAAYDLVTKHVVHYLKRSYLPPALQALPDSRESMVAYGPRTGAGLKAGRQDDGIELTLSDRSTVKIPRLGGVYGSDASSVAVSDDEKTGLVAFENGDCLVVRLTPPESAASAPASQPDNGDDPIGRLIRQLGSPQWRERQGAQNGLIAMGQTALPALHSALESKDPEIAARAAWAITEIERDLKPRPLPPRERLLAAETALDPASDDKARYEAVCDLSVSGYTRQSADALAAIASDTEYGAVLRWQASEGLRAFAHQMPEDVRAIIRLQLQNAVKAERENLPNGPLRVLVLLGDADWVLKIMGEKLRGRPEEIEVLGSISSRETALTRLWEIYQSMPEATQLNDYFKKRYVGMTMAAWQDKRGVDILIECLTAPEPGIPEWSGTSSDSPTFRHNRQNTFKVLCSNLGRSFDAPGGEAWSPPEDEPAARLIAWWKANREEWDFGQPPPKAEPRPGRVK